MAAAHPTCCHEDIALEHESEEINTLQVAGQYRSLINTTHQTIISHRIQYLFFLYKSRASL
jgi:hypothetical protein